MKELFYKLKMRLLPIFGLLAILITSFSIFSCNTADELEIQQNFPFELKVMPVPKEIADGDTVEIRISIESTGSYKENKYYLLYFQFDGQGTLQYYDEQPYLPNDIYFLPKKQFRLYYTSTSKITQSFIVWISDDFGNEKNLKFQFNSID
ncbi:protein of unknown function [Paenimyroides ummariense]|uniref:Conjugal transfer protein TraQ n=1 Tax=Paenimyroides ummariense TaxID=913024 RepID=A0A1I5GKZ0_9FLAO|nr:DUF3872 domain-containing protein [Paenimyroides ummariense]SFO36632.1 protein of unknown function [Paenimyroides ummariense]